MQSNIQMNISRYLLIHSNQTANQSWLPDASMGLGQSTSSKARSSDLILSLFASADTSNNNTTTSKSTTPPTLNTSNKDMLLSPVTRDSQEQQSASQTSRLTPRLYEFTAINERIPTRKITKKATRHGSPGGVIDPLATMASITAGTTSGSGESGPGSGSNSTDRSGSSGTSNVKVDGHDRAEGGSAGEPPTPPHPTPQPPPPPPHPTNH